MLDLHLIVTSTLNKIINATLLFLPPFFMSWTQRSKTFSMASQPQTTCNHTAQDLHIQHLHFQDRLRPATRTAAATISLHNQIISAQTIRNRARHPHWGLDLTAVHRRNRLERENAHIRWRLALWRGVLFTDLSRFSLYRADGRRRVWRCAGERFAVNVVDRVVHGGCRVMVWAGVCYGQRIQVYFIDGILNAQRYRDEVLRPIVVPFIHDNHLMLQHDNGDMSPIEHVWDALDRRIRQHVPVPANIQQLRTAIEEEWTNIPQATINNLINSMRRRCVALHEANGGHTRYRLVFGPPQYNKTAYF